MPTPRMASCCWSMPISPNTPRPAASTMSPSARRKLLVHKREAAKLAAAIQREGMTLIPLKLYFNAKGSAKIELGIAKGKKLHDKRETEKTARLAARQGAADARSGLGEIVVPAQAPRKRREGKRPSWESAVCHGLFIGEAWRAMVRSFLATAIRATIWFYRR